MTCSPRKLVFLWNNFGPTHADRVDAVAQRWPDVPCIGLEVYASAPSYDWVSEERDSFGKITLFQSGQKPGTMARFRQLLKAVRAQKGATFFLCHYERKDIWLTTLFLRLTGHKVFMMADSKFDDFPRFVFREALKSLFVRPYSGALACGVRSRDYLRFLGLPANRIALEYDTLSVKRIRSLSGAPVAPEGVSFAERDFILVARHVPKKNIALAIEAFSRFRETTGSQRKLHLCGSGPLLEQIEAQVASLGLQEAVVFHGFVQTAEVAKLLGRSLALVLPSVEEQFGLVVIEAQAMGLPVLLSVVAGARDTLVRNWQNGFIFEPDNAEGLAGFMALIDQDEVLWRRLCDGAAQTVSHGDVGAFAAGVAELAGLEQTEARL